jgi:putative FmdB family regulatory protein
LTRRPSGLHQHVAREIDVPLYEYQCRPQGHRFEVRHGINEDPVSECPECGGEVRRVIHPVGIVFKGSGFYATDSRAGSSMSKPADKPKEPAKSETTPAKSGDSADKS